MPDSDRLQQLRRQRALAAEQLAWLDQEIAALEGRPPSPPIPPAPHVASQAARILAHTAAGSALLTDATADATAEKILEQYRVAPDAAKTDVKKGCFLYFFAALAVLGLVIVALYFVFQRSK